MKYNPEGIKIEKNIPMPPKRTGGGSGTGKWQHLFKQMKVGDSVLVPIKSLKPIWVACRLINIKITRRAQPNQMARVWRIK